MPDFRNNLDKRYSLYDHIDTAAYEKYINYWKDNGLSEIEHSGRKLSMIKLQTQASKIMDIIHSHNLKSVLYTGIFGTENLHTNHELKEFAQKGSDGNILCYNNSAIASAMMCPSSRYLDDHMIPQIWNTIKKIDFDKIFIDIPWIMSNGCFCDNCIQQRSHGLTDDEILHNGIEKVISCLKNEFPWISFGINVSAPMIYTPKVITPKIERLKGLIDEYVTEWNPYRWNQDPDIIVDCIKHVKRNIEGRVYHATTLSNREGVLLSEERLENLFYHILKNGAGLRIGCGLSIEKISLVGTAYKKALEKI
jgi:hypothetical protein